MHNMPGGKEGERPRELTPEQQQNSPEVGRGVSGLPDRQRERSNLQQDNTADNPIVERVIEQTRQTKQSSAIFKNCIVRDLMPSPERVDEMLAEGRITKERAAAEKKEALLVERLYILGDRVLTIQRMFDKGGLPAEEKRSLRAEYKKLNKEWRSIRREQEEND